MSDKNRPAKSWTCTINNYTPNDLVIIPLWADDCSRMLATLEKGAGETPHIQAAMTFWSAKRASQLKKQHPRAHWEEMKAEGSAFIYCAKADSEILVHVNNTKRGERKDIAAAYDAVERHVPFPTFLRESRPGAQAISVFRTAALALTTARPIGPIEVIWRYGPTGAGKTRWAWENFPDLFPVRSHKWWDGYNGEETILIDELRGDFCRYHEMLTLLDIYPLRLEIKGGWVHAQFKRVIITSPHHPQDVWPTLEDKAQLLRRITSIVEVTSAL